MKSMELHPSLIRVASAATLVSNNSEVWKTNMPEHLLPVVFLLGFHPFRDMLELRPWNSHKNSTAPVAGLLIMNDEPLNHFHTFRVNLDPNVQLTYNRNTSHWD